MERLTYDFCVGSVHCNQVRGADNLECGEVCQRQDDDGCATCPIARAFDRLAAIEDILGDEYDLDRLRELVQADKEGRVYILPCRIGDPIYIIRRYKDGGGFVSKRKVVGAHLKDEFYRKSIPRKEYLVTRFEDYSMHIPMDWIGKRAFFDKKSAEKALEEMEGNGNG